MTEIWAALTERVPSERARLSIREIPEPAPENCSQLSGRLRLEDANGAMGGWVSVHLNILLCRANLSAAAILAHRLLITSH